MCILNISTHVEMDAFEKPSAQDDHCCTCVLQQREAGTQVELVSESSDDESPSHPEHAQVIEHFLNNLNQSGKAGEGSNLSAVLEGSGMTLYPAASAELENMIALPLVTTAVTTAHQPVVSQDQNQVCHHFLGDSEMYPEVSTVGRTLIQYVL